MQLATRTLPMGDISPVAAYAALVAQSPGRSSYFFESRVADKRYAVLGYRARSEGVYPEGGDAIALIQDELREPVAIEGLAGRLSQMLVTYLSYELVHLRHGVEPWPIQGPFGRAIKDTTVVLFDLDARQMTLAGRTENALDRCAWEMTHGPGLSELGDLEPRSDRALEYVTPSMEDAHFTMIALRAKDRLGASGVERTVLSRRFTAPLREADPIDIHRAWVELEPSAWHFIITYGEHPMAPGFQILGAASEAMVTSDEGSHALSALDQAYAERALTGAPAAASARLIRELEVEARELHGGALLCALPTGRVSLASTANTVVIRNAQAEVMRGATLSSETDPSTLAKATHDAAMPALAAIRRAQDLAEARASAEAAAEAKSAD